MLHFTAWLRWKTDAERGQFTIAAGHLICKKIAGLNLFCFLAAS
jgi:hypothetical protein